MELNILKPRKALNKAFLKVKPHRTEIQSFKTNLAQLLDRINETESEEFHKNLVITEPALTESTLYSCWSINTDIHNLFILGVLHSKIADYYIKNKLVTNPQAFPQILMTDLQSLPIPKPTFELNNSVKTLVELRLNNSENCSDLENQIDQLIYQLYDLTEEEIEIIENSVK